MTLAEIKNLIMFQTNNDKDDLGDYLPYLMDYINEGYDRLVQEEDNIPLPGGGKIISDRTACCVLVFSYQNFPAASTQ